MLRQVSMDDRMDKRRKKRLQTKISDLITEFQKGVLGESEQEADG